MQIETQRILVVEDDVKLADLVGTYLGKHHFEVAYAIDGKSGLAQARDTQPHLIILDLMLPEMDGLSVCRELRTWYRGRILVLTASDEDMDQVACLEIGADDYVTKPIHPRVLLARIRVLLRREEFEQPGATSAATDEIVYGGLSVHRGRRQVTLDGTPVVLTDAEFELLCLLAENPEQSLSRDAIMQATRGVQHDGLDRSIDNRIVALRRKLGDNKGLPKRIITVRGKGYLFVTDQW
ncbi:response regulator transcription factor [Exilibacterium tricleocarpae]|uniref:Response regulator transcription factor n=1 Tax=Exilibacterium tricleocarpae TaxID=2591008 RepID=A0A545U9W5_9GAMM|nr:response regulator transcription factor [Exilibacterium tricleocarpae]TQV86262.1 response regulator transcription factor [Exilibacterium tricleocarpae]